MAGITLATAQARLDAYLEAEEKVLAGQSYTITTGGGSRTLTRGDLGEIQKGIAIWDARVKRLTRGGIGVRLGVPVT